MQMLNCSISTPQSLPRIKQLHLKACSFEAQDFQDLLLACSPALEVMEIDKCKGLYFNQAITSIVDITPQIWSLTITRGFLEEDDTVPMGHFLERLPKLRDLDLSHPCLSSYSLQDLGPTIRTMRLRQQPISAFELVGCLAFIKGANGKSATGRTITFDLCKEEFDQDQRRTLEVRVLVWAGVRF